MLLSEAMLRTIYARTTDPRDKAYALLGLSRDGSEVVPIPNYRQDPVDVFTAISRYMIVTQGLTSLILLGGSRHDRDNVPTWLPCTYTEDQEASPLSYRRRHFSGRPPHFHCLRQLLTLHPSLCRLVE